MWFVPVHSDFLRQARSYKRSWVRAWFWELILSLGVGVCLIFPSWRQDFSVELSALSSSADGLKGHYGRIDDVTIVVIIYNFKQTSNNVTSRYWWVLFVCDALATLKDKNSMRWRGQFWQYLYRYREILFGIFSSLIPIYYFVFFRLRICYVCDDCFEISMWKIYNVFLNKLTQTLCFIVLDP